MALPCSLKQALRNLVSKLEKTNIGYLFIILLTRSHLYRKSRAHFGSRSKEKALLQTFVGTFLKVVKKTFFFKNVAEPTVLSRTKIQVLSGYVDPSAVGTGFTSWLLIGYSGTRSFTIEHMPGNVKVPNALRTSTNFSWILSVYRMIRECRNKTYFTLKL